MAAEIVKAVRIILASGMCRLPAYRREHNTLSCGRNLYQRAGGIGPTGNSRFQCRSAILTLSGACPTPRHPQRARSGLNSQGRNPQATPSPGGFPLTSAGRPKIYVGQNHFHLNFLDSYISPQLLFGVSDCNLIASNCCFCGINRCLDRGLHISRLLIGSGAQSYSFAKQICSFPRKDASENGNKKIRQLDLEKFSNPIVS